MSKKFEQDEAIQAYVQKKVDAALKAERKRVAAAVKEVEITAGSKKDAVAIQRKFKEAVAAPVLQ